MDKDCLKDILLQALRKSKGVVQAALFLGEDHQKVIDLEGEAEKRGLMGLGKVFNSGLRDVLQCEHIFLGLTNMDFDWGGLPCLVLKKGDELVGQEVCDEQTRSRLSDQENVWFMHERFVIYKDRISFPKELLDKTCYFDTPCLPATWCTLEEDAGIDPDSIIFANPSLLTDGYLKKKYFHGVDEKGLGTILVGFGRSRGQ